MLARVLPPSPAMPRCLVPVPSHPRPQAAAAAPSTRDLLPAKASPTQARAGQSRLGFAQVSSGAAAASVTLLWGHIGHRESAGLCQFRLQAASGLFVLTVRTHTAAGSCSAKTLLPPPVAAPDTSGVGTAVAAPTDTLLLLHWWVPLVGNHHLPLKRCHPVITPSASGWFRHAVWAPWQTLEA